MQFVAILAQRFQQGQAQGQQWQVLMGFAQYFYMGQRFVVNFTHFTALCPVKASKIRQIVYPCYQRQGQYIL